MHICIYVKCVDNVLDLFSSMMCASYGSYFTVCNNQTILLPWSSLIKVLCSVQLIGGQYIYFLVDSTYFQLVPVSTFLYIFIFII